MWLKQNYCKGGNREYKTDKYMIQDHVSQSAFKKSYDFNDYYIFYIV